MSQSATRKERDPSWLKLVSLDRLQEALDEASELSSALASANSVLRRYLKVLGDLLEVLRKYGVSSLADLVEKIRSGELDPHPTYEDYLEALALLDLLATTRGALHARLSEVIRRCWHLFRPERAPPEIAMLAEAGEKVEA